MSEGAPVVMIQDGSNGRVLLMQFIAQLAGQGPAKIVGPEPRHAELDTEIRPA
jgi:hypothetical protein